MKYLEHKKGKGYNRKTPQRYPDVPTTSKRISLRSMDSRTIDQSAGGKLRDRNAKESWALLEDIALYDNESWNDPRDFAKPVKAISLLEDVPSTSDRRIIELEHQIQLLMEAYIAQMQPTQVNKITSSCKICSGPHDTRYCMKNLEQAFVKYESSRTDEAGGDDDDVMFVEIIKQDDDSHIEEPEVEGCPLNLKVPCNIGHVHIEQAYIDLNSPLNVMTRMLYNWIMRRKLDPKENTNGGVNNFTGRIKGMHVFVGNFTYIIDFMIIKNISSIIDFRLSQVVLGMPFIEISNMTHDPPEGVIRFTNGTNEMAYKMDHKIEQYDSLLDLEREHTKSVYLRNEEDKRRGVEYVISKLLGFYKECLELRPEYVTRITNEGEVMFHAVIHTGNNLYNRVQEIFQRKQKGILSEAGDDVNIYPNGVIFDEKKLGIFILPVGIMHDIEQLMRGFLWCQWEIKRGKAKFSWDNVCLPKVEGGLEIRKLEAFNDVNLASNVSWGWRKLLQIRHRVRPHIWYKLGDGKQASVWFDKWEEYCPIMQHLSYRTITSAGFNFQEKVKDVILNGKWKWPSSWVVSFPVLSTIKVPLLNEEHEDCLFWRRNDGSLITFSTRDAWNSIREHGTDVAWRERNHKLLVNNIVDVIRLKLASLRFKKKASVDKMRSTWKIANIIFDGG
ncbi:MAK10-like protein [Tanacetum coccineum]